MKKRYLNILAAVVLMFSSYSCSAGWLDLEPSDEAPADETIKNMKDADIALNGVYAMIKGFTESGVPAYQEYYMAGMIYYGDVRADDVQAASTSSGRPDWLYRMTFNATSGTNNMWYIPYKVIYRANRLMKYIEDGSVSDGTKEERDNLVGQALMARAMAHFDLLRIYSMPFDLANNGDKYGVPIILKMNGYESKPGRNTINEVYASVLKDLDDAEDMMDDNNGSGRFNLWAAKALKARVYQYMENDEKAFEVAEDIIKNSPYNLWTNASYVKAWATDPIGPASDEVFFQIMIKDRTDWTDRLGIGYLCSPVGYGDMHITKSLYDLMNNEYAGDVRLGLLISSSRANLAATIKGKNVWINKYGPKEGSDDPRLSNIPLLRLSETYLIAAESAVKLNNAAKAAEYLNAIISRGNPSALTVTSSEATLDRVLQEKRVELFGEGSRYFDLIRNNKDIVRYSDDAEWHLPLNSTAKKYNRDYYRAILPVPKSEMDANPGLVGQQNPGY